MDTMEVLKQLIDMLGDASEVAGWVIGGFLVYKLIAYISVAGLIVSVCRLAIKKANDAYQRKLDVKQHIETAPRDITIHGYRFVSDAEKELPALVNVIHRYTEARKQRRTSAKGFGIFIHASDLHEVIELIKDAARKEEKKHEESKE